MLLRLVTDGGHRCARCLSGSNAPYGTVPQELVALHGGRPSAAHDSDTPETFWLPERGRSQLWGCLRTRQPLNAVSRTGSYPSGRSLCWQTAKAMVQSPLPVYRKLLPLFTTRTGNFCHFLAPFSIKVADPPTHPPTPTPPPPAFLCVDSTQRSETGQVRGLRWHNRPREWEGKECGEADGHCGLRRERPTEGKGEGRGKVRAGRKRKVKGW